MRCRPTLICWTSREPGSAGIRRWQSGSVALLNGFGRAYGSDVKHSSCAEHIHRIVSSWALIGCRYAVPSLVVDPRRDRSSSAGQACWVHANRRPLITEVPDPDRWKRATALPPVGLRLPANSPPTPRRRHYSRLLRFRCGSLETREIMTTGVYRNLLPTAQDRISSLFCAAQERHSERGRNRRFGRTRILYTLGRGRSREGRRVQWFRDRLGRQRPTSVGRCPMRPAEHCFRADRGANTLLNRRVDKRGILRAAR